MTAINTAINVISKPKLNKEYKRVLLAANSDYLELGSVLTQNDNSTFRFVGNLDNTALQFICNNGSSTHRIRTNANGSVFISLPSGSDTSAVGVINLGTNTIELVRSSGVNSLIVNGGTPLVLTGATDAFELFRFNNRSGSFSDFEVVEFEINGKIINLNVGNGDTFKSADGTITGTCETMHLNGLDYINISMIKPI